MGFSLLQTQNNNQLSERKVRTFLLHSHLFVTYRQYKIYMLHSI